MFNNNLTLIHLGELTTVLDGKGTVAMPLRFKELVDKKYELDMEVTIQHQPILKEHTGFLIPMLSAFDDSVLVTLTNSNWKLKKVLLAVSESKVERLGNNTYEIGSNKPLFDYMGSRTILRGCAHIIPLSDEEKFLCRLRGITFEE